MQIDGRVGSEDDSLLGLEPCLTQLLESPPEDQRHDVVCRRPLRNSAPTFESLVGKQNVRVREISGRASDYPHVWY